MHQLFNNKRILALVLFFLGFVLFLPKPVVAITPEDPQVKKRVENALKYLASAKDDRLGGICLIALCFKKAGIEDHPQITRAIDRCYQAPIKIEGGVDNYSLGIALMVLCEIDPQKHHDLIATYVDELLRRQKSFGAWSYPSFLTGDTSQTQYAILGMWMAKNVAHLDIIPVNRMEGVCSWLMRTQDPSGGWGYQGVDPGNFSRTAQKTMTPTLSACGAGQLYMIADLLQVTQQKEKEVAVTNTSKARQDLVAGGKKKAVRGPLTVTLDPAAIKNTLDMADRHIGTGLAEEGIWYHYYLYALERYHSFRENAGGAVDNKWYDQGYNYLAKTQGADGSWNGSDSPVSCTCLATLFLLRSAKKALDKKLGGGTAVGGMGLPPDVKSLQAKNGKVVEVGVVVPTDQIIDLINDGENDEVTRLAEEKEALELSKNPTDRNRQIEKLRKLVSAGNFNSRMVAVTTLSKVRNLDLVPQLLYALTDPDPAIVRQADKGLCFISRKVNGVGLPKGELTAAQIKSAQAAWKAWYLSIRPNAELLD